MVIAPEVPPVAQLVVATLPIAVIAVYVLPFLILASARTWNEDNDLSFGMDARDFSQMKNMGTYFD